MVSIIGQNILPKVVTIISNYNYGEYVETAIKSALEQNYQNHQVICIDDGSTDNSWDFIKGFGATSSCIKYVNKKPLEVFSNGKFYYARIENSGASVARNTAIALAKYADAIMVLDSDDIMRGDKVSKMVDKLFEWDEVGVVYGDYHIVRPDYNKIEYKQPYSSSALYSNCIVHSGSLIKKKYLDEVSKDGLYYNPDLHGPASKGFLGCTEDYQLWIRLSKVCMMVHIAEPLTLVREHGKNQSMKMTQEIFEQNLRKFNV